MGRNDEMEPAQIVSAVRDALAPHGVLVVDLTPDFVRVGGDCIGPLANLKRNTAYVLPNCKSVRKRMGRDGASAQKGSVRHAFEEHENGVRRPFLAVVNGILYGNKIPLRAPLGDACKRLQDIVGEKCAICQEPLVKKPGRCFDCNHLFHDKCLWKWTRACCDEGKCHVPCPLCRTALNPERLP